jgi:hypothetical protein
LSTRSPEIPNLISAHLGNRAPVGLTIASTTPAAVAPDGKAPLGTIAALPLGGRVKMDPWNDSLEMMKSKPLGAVAEAEKMPFEVTPFILYLTRQSDRPLGVGAQGGAVSAESKTEPAGPSDNVR